MPQVSFTPHDFYLFTPLVRRDGRSNLDSLLLSVRRFRAKCRKSKKQMKARRRGGGSRSNNVFLLWKWKAGDGWWFDYLPAWQKELGCGWPQHSTGRADVQLFTGKTASSSMNEQLLYLNELRPAFAASGWWETLKWPQIFAEKVRRTPAGSFFFFLNVPSRGGLFPMETCGMRVRVVGGSVHEWEPEYEWKRMLQYSSKGPTQTLPEARRLSFCPVLENQICCQILSIYYNSSRSPDWFGFVICMKQISPVLGLTARTKKNIAYFVKMEQHFLIVQFLFS